MPITSIEQLDLDGSYTYADYLTWQLREQLELVKGKIHRMSPAPNMYHQRLSGELFLLIGTYLREKPCELFSAPFDVRLPKLGSREDAIYTVVQPDLCVVCDAAKLDERGCLGAPDLVIEILSPGNSRRELREKFTLYEESGVLEYWVISPQDRNVQRFIRSEAGTFVGIRPLTDLDVLTSTILPGLEIDLAKVFG